MPREGGVSDTGAAAIHKAQADLRLEYDVREERRRELEFLENGGNPLDFKFGYATSQSVQSTSLTDKQAVKSGVKDSLLRTPSPPGDSVESSGRPGVSEPNTADNLLLFVSHNKSLEAAKISQYPNKRCTTSESQRSFKVYHSHDKKETDDSAIFRPYARRNRSKINRDPARSNSTDLVQSRGGLATSLSVRKEAMDVKGSDSEAGNHKTRQVPFPSSATSNGNALSKDVVPSTLLMTENDEIVVRGSTATTENSPVEEKINIAYRKSSADVASRETGLTGVKAHAVSATTVVDSLSAVMTACQETNSSQLNGLKDPREEKEYSEDRSTVEKKRLDRESSPANNVEVDVHTKVDLHRVDKSDSNSMPMQNASRVEEILNHTVGEMANTKSEDEAGEFTIIISEQNSGYQRQSKSLKVENQDHVSTVELHNEKKCSDTESKQQDDLGIPQTDIKVTSGLADASDSSLWPVTSQAATETSPYRVSKNVLPEPGITALEDQHSLDDSSSKADTLMEDSILEEARIIKEKRQMIAQLSLDTLPAEVRMRSHWDFVLEEMAWMANDFAQERLWKMTAAMQICHRAAFTSQMKLEERIHHRNLKSLASTFANAVLQFWNSVEVLREHEETSLGTNTEKVKELKSDSGLKCSASGVTEYARRFLKFMKASTPHLQVAVPSTPEHMCDPGIVEILWDDQLTEESLFYSVPSGAMEAYRGSIESHLVFCEKSGSSMHEEVETSAYDPAEDTGYSGYDEDDEETSSYYMPGALRYRKSNNLTHKKRKNSMKYHSARSYDHGAALPHGSYTGGSNPLMGKKPASNLNAGSVLMNRIRTASRHRIVSGDTSFFQDEQSSLNDGTAVQRGTEVESSHNFEKQLPYDMAETSEKPKKKSSAYEKSWHHDSMVHGEQEHRKKRQENQFNMNGLYGPHKKQKTVKESLENNLHSTIPSPAASQMSNMSNPSKFLKFIGGRDRGKKLKGLKISSGQHGSENPWTLFEDQALVVLVHDLGPNWELITDALKSTLKIKRIFRHPSDCKERHRILMDKTGGDGADSAEDSGNSQAAYPSTLPGIPKGSARQLFQRLQGPVEEDTLKSHFETICSIGKKFHHRFLQKDGRDPKQIVPVHNSQIMALSHVFPNNLNGSVLTPLDLCDTSTSCEDEFSLENSGLPMPPALPVVLESEANPSSNNLSTTSSLTSVSARFSIPRGSLPPEEQDRIQQHNQTSSGRNRQQPSLSTPAAVSGPDPWPRQPGGNAMSVNGTHRSSPLPRPGFQGVSSVPNTSSMLSSGLGGISNTGKSKSVENSTLRPRRAMQHMMRMQAGKGNGLGIPALSSGFTNQTIPSVQAHPGHLSQQHQLSQQPHVLGNSLNPHLQSPNRAAGTQQQAFDAIRQRQMARRYLQQQQQFPPAGAMPPHALPSRPQVTSSPQNSPQLQPLASSQPSPMPLSSNMTAIGQQKPLKPQLAVHGLGTNPQSGASKVNNQAGKQRQRQSHQQSGKQHPHQRQPTLGRQQNKPLKGGNIMHQSTAVMSPGVQGTEKVEATVKAMPSQPSNLVTAVNTYTESKPLNPPQYSSTSPRQAKTSPASLSLLSHNHQGKLHSDNVTQVGKSAVVPGNILSTSSLSVTPAVAQSNHQPLLLQQKQGDRPQLTSHRTVHQSHCLSKQSQAENSQRDPQSVINTTQTASIGVTKGVPQTSISSVRTTTVGSTAVNPPSKELDLPSCHSSEKTGKLSSSIKNSTGRDPVTDMAQELGIFGHGDKAVTERQQQQLRQSSPLVQRTPQLSEQLIVQNQKHIPSEQQKQQPYLKTLELEAIHEKSTQRPPDTKVE